MQAMSNESSIGRGVLLHIMRWSDFVVPLKCECGLTRKEDRVLWLFSDDNFLKRRDPNQWRKSESYALKTG
jgi:hypothetical protein